MIASQPLARAGSPDASPFSMRATRAYAAWREQKLASAPTAPGDLLVELDDAGNLKTLERKALLGHLARCNMALYQLRDANSRDKAQIRQLGLQLGLKRLDSNLCSDEDGITALQVVEKRREGEYIPYTNKRLNWHTDGYYNASAQQVRGVILHCVQPAQSGGENAFMDHEMAYIQLRDENPDYVRALMEPDAMIVPANVQAGREIRPVQGGPVFSVDSDGHLHMRYSARTRNIIWKDNPTTQAAADYLLNLFQGDSPYIFRHRLEAGQGFISNNVLHCRTEFNHDDVEGQGRLLYRARYYDRVADVVVDG